MKGLYPNRIQITNNTVNRVICIFSAVFFLLLLSYRILLIFTYDGEIGGIDNNFVSGTIRMAAGLDIYSNPENLPFSVNQYTPLFFELSSGLTNLLNVDYNASPISVYWVCRSLSLFFDTLTIIIFFFALNRNLGIKRPIALLLVVFFFYLLGFYGYTYSRADSLYLCFYALILFILTRKETLNNSFIFVLVLLTTLCIFSKQNGIITPLLILITLIGRGNKQKAIIYFLATGSLLAIATITYSIQHPYFTKNVINGIANRLDLSWFYGYIFKPFALTLPALCLYYAAVICFRSIRKNNSNNSKNLPRLFIAQLGFSLAISLKWGATLGYFYESFLLAIMLIGIELMKQTFISQMSWGRIAGFLLPLIVIFYIFTLSQIHLFFIQRQPMKKEIYYGQLNVSKYIKREYPGTYIIEIGNINRSFFKTICYKQYALPNFDVLDCCTYPDKTFDYRNLKYALAKGEIGVIVTDNTQPSKLWNIDIQNFKYDTSFNQYSVYIHDKMKNITSH